MSEAGKVSLTPEQIEDIREFVKTLDPECELAGWIYTLLAALEEAQQQRITAKEERDSQQRVCIKVMEELAEAQQTIARLTAALIAERDDALTWDGIGTVNRINKALGETQP